MLSGTGPCPVEVYKTCLLMDEREMGFQPPVIILDHFSFTSLSLSHSHLGLVGVRGSFRIIHSRQSPLLLLTYYYYSQFSTTATTGGLMRRTCKS